MAAAQDSKGPTSLERAARVAIVHATRNSIQPISDAFAKHWPEAEPINILDESLLIDRRAAGSRSKMNRSNLMAFFASPLGTTWLAAASKHATALRAT